MLRQPGPRGQLLCRAYQRRVARCHQLLVNARPDVWVRHQLQLRTSGGGPDGVPLNKTLENLKQSISRTSDHASQAAASRLASRRPSCAAACSSKEASDVPSIPVRSRCRRRGAARRAAAGADARERWYAPSGISAAHRLLLVAMSTLIALTTRTRRVEPVFYFSVDVQQQWLQFFVGPLGQSYLVQHQRAEERSSSDALSALRTPLGGHGLGSGPFPVGWPGNPACDTVHQEQQSHRPLQNLMTSSLRSRGCFRHEILLRAATVTAFLCAPEGSVIMFNIKERSEGRLARLESVPHSARKPRFRLGWWLASWLAG